jgi:hypothetical protein
MAPLETQADVFVRGYTRRDGTYVRPHYRSNPDGNVANNWSTRGNVNPYTGQPGTRSYPSQPASSPAPSWSPVDTAAVVAAQEWARGELELKANRERLQGLREQARRSVEAKINAAAQARRAQWQETEAQTESEERANLTATMAERWKDWLAREAQTKREAASRLAQEMADYARQWDDADLNLENRLSTTRRDAARNVAESHALVAMKFAGDGQQARRDAQRKRNDAMANAARDVREKRLAQYQRDSRASAEDAYQVAAYSRLQTAEQQRLMAWAKQQTEYRVAMETKIRQEAFERLASFNLRESTLIAQAKAEGEQVLLSLEESWTRGPATTSVSDPRDDQPSAPETPPSSAPTGLLLTGVAAGAGLLRMLKN